VKHRHSPLPLPLHTCTEKTIILEKETNVDNGIGVTFDKSDKDNSSETHTSTSHAKTKRR
jgi:hypothetical protein